MSENEHHVTVHRHIPAQRGSNQEGRSGWWWQLSEVQSFGNSGKMKAKRSKNHLKHVWFSTKTQNFRQRPLRTHED